MSNPVLKFEIDPEEYIEHMVQLKEYIKKQDDLNRVVQEHMRVEDRRWAQINTQVAVIGVLLLALLFGVDLSPMAGAVAGYIGG